MTHQELLKMVKFGLDVAESKYLQEDAPYLQALLAVVELHKPVMQWSGGYDGEDNPIYAEQCSDCSNNGFTQEYPCPTIRAIEKELQ